MFDCWYFARYINNWGYGQIFNTRTRKAEMVHRIMYETFVGDIPKDYQIDHLCMNRSCINPDHLEAVTRTENLKRAPNYPSNRVVCPKGHKYDRVMIIGVRPARVCTKCRREASARHYKKIKIIEEKNNVTN